MVGNAVIIEFSTGDNLEAKLVQKYMGIKNPARIKATTILTLAGDSIMVPTNKPKETAHNPPTRIAIIIMSQWVIQRQLNAKIISDAIRL